MNDLALIIAIGGGFVSIAVSLHGLCIALNRIAKAIENLKG